MTIYKLYVKTHNKTGLKYLGYTKATNAHKYTGSGNYWKLHLKKHGKDYSTEILKECQTKDEIKEYGLYYSNLWNIVESDEWANLKPETGDGNDSETARLYNLKRILNRTHNFLNNGEASRKVQLDKIANGTHHFLGDTNPVYKQLESGTHPFSGPDHNKKMITAGKIGGEASRKVQLDKIANGTHHFLGDANPSKQRSIDGTHHFYNKEVAHERNLKRIREGTHSFIGDTNPSKTKLTCPHCNKTGGMGGMILWHFDKCRNNPITE